MSLAYEAPGLDDAPVVGPFFGSYYLLGSPRVTLYGNLQYRGVSVPPMHVTTGVRDTLVVLGYHAVAMGPFIYALLLPNYWFPEAWYISAEVSQ